MSLDPLSEQELFEWLNAWADLDKHCESGANSLWRAGYMRAVRDIGIHLFGPDDEASQ